VIEPRAGLVPLTFDTETLSELKGLSGISLEATVKLGKVSFSEGLLFTHKGISGPVILQISSYWQKGDAITIDLLPGINVFQFLKDAKDGKVKKDVGVALGQLLPKRLAQRMIDWTGCAGRLAEIPDKSLRHLADQINAWVLVPSGSEGMKTAEVTVGGVNTKELSSRTMEATAVQGLYFIGEVVDVTGHLGGFNFQWAWASGHACGQVA
jgi:predicted Rossmann fold flavoprotein